MTQKHTKGTIFLHVGLFLAGLALAIALIHSDIFDYLVSSAGVIYAVPSFLAGIFFTSMITIAPATVVFYHIGQTGAPLLVVAVIGGLGAMIGDMILFQFMKFSIVDDITAFALRHSHGHLQKLMRIKMFSITMIILGAIIIASPLPDELGLAMMGLTKVKRATMASISFTLNTLGVLVVLLISRGFLV